MPKTSKIDILDYINIDTVENHYGIKKGTLKYDRNKDKLEKIIQNRIKRKITQDDIEKMVLMLKVIPPDLKRILDKIKFIQDTYTDLFILYFRTCN